MDISKWDTKELKALAYDLSRTLSQYQNDLRTVNEEINRKETPNAQAVPNTDSPDVPECCDSEPCDQGDCEGVVLPSERADQS